MKKGFTLLELLVVILIISILAAVALPQYYKSKEKAEAVELQIMVKALQESQQRYYMVNNDFATSFDELDMDYEGYKRGGCEAFSIFSPKDCFSNEKNVLFISNAKNSFALRKKGKYKRSGFAIFRDNSELIKANRLMCYAYLESDYCTKLFNSALIQSDTVNAYYSFQN